MLASSFRTFGLVTILASSSFGSDAEKVQQAPAPTTPPAHGLPAALPVTTETPTALTFPGGDPLFKGQCVVTRIEPRRCDPIAQADAASTCTDLPAIYWVKKGDPVARKLWVVGRTSGWVNISDVMESASAIASIEAENSDANLIMTQGLAELLRPATEADRPNPIAIAQFTAILRQDPSNAQAYYFRAIGYARGFLGREGQHTQVEPIPAGYQRALGDLTESLRLRRDWPAALLTRSAVLNAMGDYEKENARIASGQINPSANLGAEEITSNINYYKNSRDAYSRAIGWYTRGLLDLESVLVVDSRNCLARDEWPLIQQNGIHLSQGLISDLDNKIAQAQVDLENAESLARTQQRQEQSASSKVIELQQKLDTAKQTILGLESEIQGLRIELTDAVNQRNAAVNPDDLAKAKAAAAIADVLARAKILDAQAAAAAAQAAELDGRSKEAAARAREAAARATRTEKEANKP